MTSAVLTTPIEYNVECGACGQVFTPTPGSSLWWQAKKRAERGFLDALRCTGRECGCEKERDQPDAPFRVFGHDDMCRNFNVPYGTFVLAVKAFKETVRAGGCVVFISGVSQAVQDKIEFGW